MSRLPHVPITTIVICGALLALLYLGYTTATHVHREYQLREEESRLEREIDQLDRDHEYLVAVRDYLKSDEYIEDVARRILGLVRPGETLVVVSSSASAAAAATPVADRTPGSPWWKDLFVQPQIGPAPTPTLPPAIDAPATAP